MTFNQIPSPLFLCRRALAIKGFSAALAIACLLCSQITLAQTDMALASVKASKTPLEDKLYRQALYFYFAGDYAAALRQVSLNEQRHGIISPRSDLFEAGMQVNIGLHKQATDTLLAFERTHSSASASSNDDKDTKSTSSPSELLLIALLQLSEQQIEQGDNQAAQQTLARINSPAMHQAMADYSEQYQVLRQLAYWPNAPIRAANIIEAQSSPLEIPTLSSAYIALNSALQYIEQQEFVRAESILTQVKTRVLQTQRRSFWQQLFNPFSSGTQDLFDSQGRPIKDTVLQQQAVKDYASLLLAKMYVMQQEYHAAFNELANFPEHSPYFEQALYLFAFAAQNAGQDDTALYLLDLMQQQFPYSHLGWQAALLSAAQASQNSLPQGLARYQQAEQLYLNQLADLTQFKHSFLNSSDLASFVRLTKPSQQSFEDELELLSHTPFTTASKWLKKALLDAPLATDFQAVLTLDSLNKNLSQQQLKSDWIKQTLVLNKLRQSRVLETQQQTPYGEMIAELTQQKMRLAQRIADAKTHQDGQVFATQKEQQWLKRIKESQQALAMLAPKRDTESYRLRLDRVSSVLQWQLQQDFAARLWLHQKRLQQLGHQLESLETQSARFNALSASQPVYADFDLRQQANDAQIKQLAANIGELRLTARHQINQKVAIFVATQQQELSKLLLSSRHAMAAVLEQMAEADPLPALGAQQ